MTFSENLARGRPDPAAESEQEVADILDQTARIRFAAPDENWERLRCILELSFDYYWELDPLLRVCQIWHADEDERARLRALLHGKTRWEVGGHPINGTWDEHKATLEAHEAFENFIVEWMHESGELLYLRYAGRPRFDEAGQFRGYMGITQNATQQILREKLDSLELVVAKVLLSGEASAASLNTVLSSICETFHWRYGRLWMPAREKAELCLLASTRSEMAAAANGNPRAPRIGAGHGVLGLAWASYLESGRWEDPAPDGVVGDATGGYARIAALLNHDELLGVLEFGLPPASVRRREGSLPLARICDQLVAALERDQALSMLRQSEERFASTVELAAIGICHVDMNGRLIHVNGQMTKILGYTRDELLAMSVWDLSHPEDRDASSEALAQLTRRDIGSFKLEKRYLHKDGKTVWVRISTVMKWSSEGAPLHHISIVEDISDRKEAQERIEHLARHDGLTGLPNRTMFGEILSGRIDRAQDRARDAFAVLFVDVDRFKGINDSLGHQAGDNVLNAVAGRISHCVRTTDRVARFGGDEFVILLDNVKDPSQAAAVAEKILHSLHVPVCVNGRELRVTASIGIACYPEDGIEPDVLMKNADMAMYAAKEAGRNEVRRYNIDLGTTSVRQITLETHLVRGLERDEFRLQYQPRVDAKTGVIVGAEALMRWWNSELGTISPVQFIPVAEDSGLIIPMGRWAIRKACEHAVQWRRKGANDLSVSVNLSPKQFRDADLTDYIRATLKSTGLPPERLELEITESAVMSNLEEAVRIATAIRNIGVRLALDDFGTGYSSLAQLRRIPLDVLKIDRSFIRSIDSNDEDRAITAAIVEMASRLGIATVAEGVETKEQVAILSELRCEQLQGYYFGAACHPDEVFRMVRSQDS